MNIILYTVTIVLLFIYIYVDLYMVTCKKLKKFYDSHKLSYDDVKEVVALPESLIHKVIQPNIKINQKKK